MPNFKVDDSFLRFLTMGAIGVRHTMEVLKRVGFEPVELERSASSNKIWATKIKRLRLPDVICAKTGLRLEVRAKSKLAVRMSDAPNNPERRWSHGLRSDDLIAFVLCGPINGVTVALADPVFVAVGALSASEGMSKLGPPKSASEGSERDREWPTTVPGSDGRVLRCTSSSVQTELASGRRQTYQLRGKCAYVQPGDRFSGGRTIIAGVVPRLEVLSRVPSHQWDPVADIRSDNPLDRYAATKAIRERIHRPPQARSILREQMNVDVDSRIALEMAGTLATFDYEEGWSHIDAIFTSPPVAFEIQMETALILAEIGTPKAASRLQSVGQRVDLEGSELRQAAVWGLGWAGAQQYEKLLPFIADPDPKVALHAITAFDAAASDTVVDKLVAKLRAGAKRDRACAAEALLSIATPYAGTALASAAAMWSGPDRHWALSTLSRLPDTVLAQSSLSDQVRDRIEPMLISRRWASEIGGEPGMSDIAFLRAQHLSSPDRLRKVAG